MTWKYYNKKGVKREERLECDEKADFRWDGLKLFWPEQNPICCAVNAAYRGTPFFCCVKYLNGADTPPPLWLFSSVICS